MRTLVELRLPAMTEVDDENQAVNYSKVVSAPPFALLRLTGTIKGAGVLSEGILSADTFLIADDGTRVMMGSNGTFLSIPANMEIEFSIDTFINESITKNQRFQLLLRHLDGKVGYLAHGEINLQ